MSKENVKNCSVRDGKFVEPCELLAEATEYGNPRKAKGIWAWAFHNKDGPTRTMFGVKSGAHTKDGVLFNYCPFCGERIDAPFSEKQ